MTELVSLTSATARASASAALRGSYGCTATARNPDQTSESMHDETVLVPPPASGALRGDDIAKLRAQDLTTTDGQPIAHSLRVLLIGQKFDCQYGNLYVPYQPGLKFDSMENFKAQLKGCEL